MVTSMEHAFRVARERKVGPGSIAQRDRVALDEGHRYRCIYRSDEQGIRVAYGRTAFAAIRACVNEFDYTSPFGLRSASLTPLTADALRADYGPHYPDDHDEI